MSETILIWLENLYLDAITEAEVALSNERLWEKGYTGKDPNPHTENIITLVEYIGVLEEKLEELE